MRRSCGVVVSVVVLLAGDFSPRGAAAAIVGVESIMGDIEFIDPPASLLLIDFGGTKKIGLFAERQSVVIPEVTLPRGGSSSLQVDHDGSSGFFERAADQMPTEIRRGARVNSHYLVFRPLDVANQGTPLESAAATGTVTFATPIMGLFTADVSSTNKLPDIEDTTFGLDEVLYPTGGGALELAPEATFVADSFSISADRRTLQLNFQATTNLDRIRVLTQVAPEPNTVALVLLALVCATAKRWKRGAGAMPISNVGAWTSRTNAL